MPPRRQQVPCIWIPVGKIPPPCWISFYKVHHLLQLSISPGRWTLLKWPVHSQWNASKRRNIQHILHNWSSSWNWKINFRQLENIVELINEFEDKTIIIIITIIFFLQIGWWRELMSFYWELDGNIIQGAFFLDVTHNAMISQFPQTIHETKETLSGGITKSVG